jgi:hypothetical protein
MSLKEELQNLDPERVGRAIANVIARTSFEREGSDGVSRQLVDSQPTLAIMPDAISNTLTNREPGIDEQQATYVRVGMTLLASVLCEYADLEDLQNQFPDVAPEA